MLHRDGRSPLFRSVVGPSDHLTRFPLPPSPGLSPLEQIEELHKNGQYRLIGQAFVVLLPVKSVGVMGDGRTYENVCAVRCVQTTDYMTADWCVIGSSPSTPATAHRPPPSAHHVQPSTE